MSHARQSRSATSNAAGKLAESEPGKSLGQLPDGYTQYYGLTVQHKLSGSAADGPSVQEAAASGISGVAGSLPFADQIQQSFGHHDVSRVQAHTDAPAASGARAMGAEAFAVGDHVAFGGAPSLHTAAHEAAHVVQQRAGVHLKGGVGQDGDAYEQHADAVADRVVHGASAEALLDVRVGAPAGQPAVQRKIAYPIDCGDGKVGSSKTRVIDLLAEHFCSKPRVFIEGRVEAMAGADRVYTTWEDLVEGITDDHLAPKSKQPAPPAPSPDQAAQQLVELGLDATQARQAAVAAVRHLHDELGRDQITTAEIVKIAQSIALVFNRVTSVLALGVLSPQALKQKKVGYTSSSDKSEEGIRTISAYDIDLTRNQPEHEDAEPRYQERFPKPGHQSINPVVERQDDIYQLGKSILEGVGQGNLGALNRVLTFDDPKVPEHIVRRLKSGIKVSDEELQPYILPLGYKQRFSKTGTAELGDRANNSAMVVSTGAPLEKAPVSKMMGKDGLSPKVKELRRETEIPPEALTHVILPEHLRWYQPVRELMESGTVDVRFAGRVVTQVGYYDESSRVQRQLQLDVPDYQSELEKLWAEGNVRMLTHITNV